MPVDIDRETQKIIMKEAMKEAMKEWLDGMFEAFGKWTLGGLAAAGLIGVVYLALSSQGWHRP